MYEGFFGLLFSEVWPPCPPSASVQPRVFCTYTPTLLYTTRVNGRRIAAARSSFFSPPSFFTPKHVYTCACDMTDSRGKGESLGPRCRKSIIICRICKTARGETRDATRRAHQKLAICLRYVSRTRFFRAYIILL